VVALCTVSTFSARANVRTIIQRSVGRQREGLEDFARILLSCARLEPGGQGTDTYRVLLLLGTPYSYHQPHDKAPQPVANQPLRYSTGRRMMVRKS
jgi:hypothetical protein